MPANQQILLVIAYDPAVHLEISCALQGTASTVVSVRSPDEALASLRSYRLTWVISEFLCLYEGSEVALRILKLAPGAKGLFFTPETPREARGRGYDLPVLFRPFPTPELRDLLVELFAQ